MKNKLLLTSEFAKLCRTSKKHILELKKYGLLTPIETNPESGYNYYSKDQVDDYHKLMNFKMRYGLTYDEMIEKQEDNPNYLDCRPDLEELKLKKEQLVQEMKDLKGVLVELSYQFCIAQNEETMKNSSNKLSKKMKNSEYTIKQIEQGWFANYRRSHREYIEEEQSYIEVDQFTYSPQSFADAIEYNREKCFSHLKSWHDCGSSFRFRPECCKGFFSMCYNDCDNINVEPVYNFVLDDVRDYFHCPYPLSEREKVEAYIAYLRETADLYSMVEDECFEYTDQKQFYMTYENFKEALCYVFKGNYKDLVEEVIPNMVKYCKEKGIQNCGLFRCFPIIGSRDIDDQNQYVTEVQLIINDAEISHYDLYRLATEALPEYADELEEDMCKYHIEKMNNVFVRVYGACGEKLFKECCGELSHCSEKERTEIVRKGKKLFKDNILVFVNVMRKHCPDLVTKEYDYEKFKESYNLFYNESVKGKAIEKEYSNATAKMMLPDFAESLSKSEWKKIYSMVHDN